MQYSKDLDIVINNAMKDLIEEYKSNAFMFDKENNLDYLNLYLKIKSEEVNNYE